MDIKIAGITEEIMRRRSTQAKEGRAHILGEMTKALGSPRDRAFGARAADRDDADRQVEDPRRHRHRRQGDPRDRRRDRRQGRHRRRGRDQDLARPTSSQIEAARKWILGIVEEAEVGKIYDGKVVNIVDFGAFVNFMGGKDGLVHVSEMQERAGREARPTSSTEGQEVKVKVLEIDQRGKVRLSMRVVDQETGEELEDTRPPREPREGGDRRPRPARRSRPAS